MRMQTISIILRIEEEIIYSLTNGEADAAGLRATRQASIRSKFILAVQTGNGQYFTNCSLYRPRFIILERRLKRGL